MEEYEEEFKNFLIYLYREYIESRLPGLRRRWWSSSRGRQEWDDCQGDLIQATRLFRLAYRECETMEDVYETFCAKRIARGVREIERGVAFSEKLTEEAGILDCLDTHYNRILEGLKVEHFPQDEFQVLRDVGSYDPENDLAGMISMLKMTEMRHYRLPDEGGGYSHANTGCQGAP